MREIDYQQIYEDEVIISKTRNKKYKNPKYYIKHIITYLTAKGVMQARNKNNFYKYYKKNVVNSPLETMFYSGKKEDLKQITPKVIKEIFENIRKENREKIEEIKKMTEIHGGICGQNVKEVDLLRSLNKQSILLILTQLGYKVNKNNIIVYSDGNTRYVDINRDSYYMSSEDCNEIKVMEITNNMNQISSTSRQIIEGKVIDYYGNIVKTDAQILNLPHKGAHYAFVLQLIDTTKITEVIEQEELIIQKKEKTKAKQSPIITTYSKMGKLTYSNYTLLKEIYYSLYRVYDLLKDSNTKVYYAERGLYTQYNNIHQIEKLGRAIKAIEENGMKKALKTRAIVENTLLKCGIKLIAIKRLYYKEKEVN